MRGGFRRRAVGPPIRKRLDQDIRSPPPGRALAVRFKLLFAPIGARLQHLLGGKLMHDVARVVFDPGDDDVAGVLIEALLTLDLREGGRQPLTRLRNVELDRG